MNYRFILIILILLMFVQLVHAAPVIDNVMAYTIVTDTTIVEHHIQFSEEQLSWEMKIPLDSEAIEVTGASYDISETDEYKIISANAVKEINLKYISDGFVEKTTDRYFTINLGAIPGSKDITVILPESAFLKYSLDSPKSSLIPATEDITTDGKRITLHWSTKDLEDANSLLVIYDEPEVQGLSWKYFSILAIITVIIGYILIKKKNKKKKSVQPVDASTDLTRNLFEEERAIIEVLLKSKDKEMWQKQLIFETGISKVRMSRKLRALEAKGLIERIPYGNTNKIRLKQQK
ncbi:hypothetical protein KY326_01765 [Candidatus Woesearchaeota archaeon]|nr:hypothetical protein [Candidatus Woesearchaeota archaeon]